MLSCTLLYLGLDNHVTHMHGVNQYFHKLFLINISIRITLYTALIPETLCNMSFQRKRGMFMMKWMIMREEIVQVLDHCITKGKVRKAVPVLRWDQSVTYHYAPKCAWFRSIAMSNVLGQVPFCHYLLSFQFLYTCTKNHTLSQRYPSMNQI